jgi:hypothetical protein
MTAAHLEFAEAHGWDSSRAKDEFERFADYHRAKGSVFANWDAAWRTWVRNGIKFDSERLQRGTARGRGQTVVDGALSYANGRNQDD